MSDFSTWFKSIPFVTRHWLAFTVGLTLIGKFGIVGGQHLILWYEPFINQFQIWRPITALFYYPLSPKTGFHFLINCYFLYNYSVRLETSEYAGKRGDYFFLLFFNWLACVVLGLAMDIYLLMDPMVLSVLYIWCNLNRDTIVSFWFGSRFKAIYLPWVLLAFNAIVAGGGVMELVGIIVGHLYYFLMYTYPREMGGPTLISTPQFILDWFPNERPSGGPTAFGRPPEQGARRTWRGTGYTLGGQ
ncbi:Der1-like family [Nesidiocoris tenuis]|uniref:Derlin n=1 Tax=Nesidiocoris tenuis TaxID=355587 RepID=A0ABN7B9M3_9HEMI|nr:Der1-like family [Nesidiocoris tenuis]